MQKSRQQVADFFEKVAVGGAIVIRPGVRTVPGIDPGLQLLAGGQQLPVARCQLREGLLEARPESLLAEAGTGKNVLDDQSVECLRDPEPAFLDSFAHRFSA